MIIWYNTIRRFRLELRVKLWRLITVTLLTGKINYWLARLLNESKSAFYTLREKNHDNKIRNTISYALIAINTVSFAFFFIYVLCNHSVFFLSVFFFFLYTCLLYTAKSMRRLESFTLRRSKGPNDSLINDHGTIRCMLTVKRRADYWWDKLHASSWKIAVL